MIPLSCNSLPVLLLWVSPNRRDLESRDAQLDSARAAATAKDGEARAAVGAASATAADMLRRLAEGRSALEARMAGLEAQLAAEQQRHAEEMSLVEARVRAALARRDDTITHLSSQLADAQAAAAATDALIAAQREYLCD